MAKRTKHFVPLNQMSKKDKFLHFLKIFGISFAGVMAMVAGVVIYVWASGGFYPPYVPLSEWAFSQAEYVIDGNKEVELDENGNQKYDENGNLSFVQKKDKTGKDLYEYVMLVPNEKCTELEATIKLSFSSNANMPVIQLIEDENTKALDVTEDDDENTLHEKYSVKIGSPIYIKPVTTLVDEKETNIGGWIKLTATQNLMQTSCWVFVDVPVDSLTLSVKNSENYDTETVINNDEEFEQYDVSPNDVIDILSTIMPTSSTKYPKTSVPQAKGSTSFNLTKNIYYEVSNEEIAQISNNGKITINKNKEGESFSVSAYVISQYNQLGHIPSLQDFVDDPNRDPSQLPEDLYKRALNKICVRSNVINFKIKEIEIDGLTVGDKTVNIEPYNLFEQGTITFSRNTTHVQKNNYFADLTFTDDIDEGYRNVLVGRIQLAVVMEDGIAEQVEQEITHYQDITINNFKVTDASTYIYLKNVNGSWKYVVKQYADNNFYLVFYYVLEDETLVYDYMPITLSTVMVSNLVTKTDKIDLNLSKDTTSTYSLKNFATITPSNTKNDTVMYFVKPEDDRDKNKVIISDGASVPDENDIFIKVGEDTLYPIANIVDDEILDYTTLVAKNIGTTRLYCAVLKKIPVIDEDTCSILSYEYLRGDDGDIQWEYCNDDVTINIAKDVEFIDIELVNAEQLEDIIYDYGYESYSLYVEMYQGEKITVELTYDEESYHLDNNAIDFSDRSYIDNAGSIGSGKYRFDISASKVGSITYQVLYNSSKGVTPIYTIKIVVISTELVGINLSAPSNKLTVSFESNGNDNNGNALATAYNWNDVDLNVQLNSPKSTAVYELRTYKLPDGFESKLAYYAGKDYEEVILDPAVGSLNTIKKLIESLEIDRSIISIDNLKRQSPSYSGYFVIGDNRIGYDFVGTGKVLLVAESESQFGISSNPIIIEVEEINVNIVYGAENNQENAFRDVYSQGVLTSIDGKITPAKFVDVRKTESNYDINFYTTINNVKYNISNLIKYRFAQQDTLDSSKSSVSGATLTQSDDTYFLNFVDVSRNLAEKIVAYTDFGYMEPDFYTYTLKPDYVLTNSNPNASYLTPSILDLFGGIVKVTDALFNNEASNTNKLFLPRNYAETIDEVKQKLGNDFVNLFYYNDGKGESYYHVYCNLKISEPSTGSSNEDYDYRNNGNGTIRLTYKENGATIFINFETPAGKIINTKTKTTPGIKGAFVYTSNKVYAFSASNIDNIAQLLIDGYNITLIDKLLFTDSNNNYLNNNNFEYTSYIVVENPQLAKISTYYELSGGEYILTQDEEIVPNKTYYIIEYKINFKDVNFAITNQTNNDLMFFLTDSGSMIEGYTVVDQDYFNYVLEDGLLNLDANEFAKTDDTHIVSNKLYFEENYVTVSMPIIENIDKYYELSNNEYIKTQDTELDAGKQYYTLSFKIVDEPSDENLNKYYQTTYKRYFVKNTEDTLDTDKKYYEYTDNEYVLVDDPQLLDLANYYIAVYSKEVYYKLVEPQYILVENKTSQYSLLYYEKSYVKTEDTTINLNKTYFELNNDVYTEVVNPVQENIGQYYEEVYSPISVYNDDGTYYYKYSYSIINENECIDGAFYRFTIDLIVEKTNENVISCKLVLSKNVKYIMQTLYLTLNPKVEIVNMLADDCTYTYSGFYYNIMIEGYEQ